MTLVYMMHDICARYLHCSVEEFSAYPDLAKLRWLAYWEIKRQEKAEKMEELSKSGGILGGLAFAIEMMGG